jgi:hypothetical protein
VNIICYGGIMISLKKTKGISICLLVFSFFIIGCGQDHYVIGNKYFNKTAGLTFNAPESGWVMTLTGDGVKITDVKGAQNGMIEFLIKDVKNIINPEDYIVEYINKDFKSFSSNIKIKKEKIKIGKNTGYLAEFDGSYEYTPKSYGVALFLNGNRAYIFTSVFPASAKEKYKKYFFPTIKSFKFN